MTSELGRRVAFTLGALLVYRFALYIPLPGIDPSVWEQLFRSQAGGILGAFNTLSGGGIQRLSILALNIVPYLSASILVQLMTIVSPQLEQLKRESEPGRKVMFQYTRYLTFFLAIFQSYGISIGLEGAGSVVSNPGWIFRISTVITLTGGTMFLVWLSELITARGIGNGLSLILFVGIVVEVPAATAGVLDLARRGLFSEKAIVLMGVVVVALTALVVHVERARRRLVVSFAERRVGTQMIGGQSHLSLKLNSAGALIPTWLASLFLSLLYFGISLVPGLEERLAIIVDQLANRGPLFMVFYAVLIIGIALLYTAFIASPDDVARRLEKYGGRLAGVEPGEPTAQVLDGIFTNTAAIGVSYLALVCLVPEMLVAYMGVPFYFGGASLLVVVCTILDLDDEIRGGVLREGRG
jgi:preprotein translocase subunit SecY